DRRLRKPYAGRWFVAATGCGQYAGRKEHGGCAYARRSAHVVSPVEPGCTYCRNGDGTQSVLLQGDRSSPAVVVNGGVVGHRINQLHQFIAVADVELLIHTVDVCAHGVDAQLHVVRDGGAALSVENRADDERLLFGEVRAAKEPLGEVVALRFAQEKEMEE